GAVNHLVCHFDVIPCAAIFHIKEPPVYGNQRIVFPCKLSGCLEPHGISRHQNPFPVFPEVYFYQVDFLLAFEEVIKMALLPYDAFLDRCNRPFLLSHRNGIKGLTPCSRLKEKERAQKQGCFVYVFFHLRFCLSISIVSKPPSRA